MPNEKKHTPGDWLNSQGYIVCKGGYTVAHVNSHNTTEGSANADLIARAPALLAENETLRAQNAELVRALDAVVKRYAPTASSGNDAIARMWADARAILATVQS